jgi:hypothetical protein
VRDRSTFNHGIGGKGAAGKNGRLIEGKVKLTSHGAYSYEVRYSDAAGDHLLVEKEIVVEGTPEIPAKITRRGESGLGVRAAKSGSGVRPPAKRASGVRPAAPAEAKPSAKKTAARKQERRGKGSKTKEGGMVKCTLITLVVVVTTLAAQEPYTPARYAGGAPPVLPALTVGAGQAFLELTIRSNGTWSRSGRFDRRRRSRKC